MVTPVEVKIVGYNKNLLEVLLHHYQILKPDKKLACKELFNSTELKIELYRTALRWKRTPTKRYMLVPGVGTDCIGSVLGVLIESGILTYPSLLMNTRRAAEDWDDLLLLNMRMQAFLAYILLKCVKRKDVAYFPIINPETFMCGDILCSPYIMSVGGILVPPHVCMMVSDYAVLSSDFASDTLVIQDISTTSFTILSSKIEETITYPVHDHLGRPLHGILFRPYLYSPDTPEYKAMKKDLFKIFRGILKNVKEGVDN